MFIFFNDKKVFESFKHDMAIKIFDDNLLSSVTWGDHFIKDEKYSKVVTPYLKYNILISYLMSLQGHLLMSDVSPFDILEKIEKENETSDLLNNILRFQLPSKYKMFFVDYTDVQKSYIAKTVVKMINGAELQISFLSYDTISKVLSKAGN